MKKVAQSSALSGDLERVFNSVEHFMEDIQKGNLIYFKNLI